MRVDLLAVGSELLYGDIVNTNAAWLGQRLSDLGMDVGHTAAVGDDIEDISAAIRAGLANADVLLVTGGLGPTQDDLTREGLAHAAGVQLRRDPVIEEELFTRFRRLRRAMPEMNFRQADVPEGAWTFPNPSGTAPGLAMELPTGLVVCLPGVPHEMQAMVVDSVLGLLTSRDPARSVIVHRIIRTVGMYESAVAEAMAPQVERVAPAGNPVIAFLASGGMTRVKITARAATEAEARLMVEPVEKFAREVLGPAIFGVDDDSLEGVLLDELKARGATLSTAESLTGGQLAARLVAVPGASAVVVGGVVAYSPAVKHAVLGVDQETLDRHGVVSEQCAIAMATGARELCGSTYALATTGVAGPESLEGHIPGTVFVAVAHPSGCETRELKLPGDRERIRDYACVSALDLLRRHLSDHDDVVGTTG